MSLSRHEFHKSLYKWFKAKATVGKGKSDLLALAYIFALITPITFAPVIIELLTFPQAFKGLRPEQILLLLAFMLICSIPAMISYSCWLSHRARLRRAEMFGGAYCLTCQYPLTQLTSQACPECGRSFDLRDSSTYLPVLSRSLPVDAIGAVACALAFMWCTLLMPTVRGGLPDFICYVPPIFCGALAIGFALGGLRSPGLIGKVISGVILLPALFLMIGFVYNVGWETIWEYWTYRHWRPGI